ncbi:MAG: type II toxin-antitoxin system VapC family toxin [Deltaproteobacteria bacterium]|nr:type II toxin-antitoxin system VapC family toxin [Deltaproteobacteria bacterium]
MLIDTDVLIWYMKGNEKAYNAIENSENFFISVVTFMELVQGMRNKTELNTLRKAEQHYLSYSIQLADSLIGATAIAYGLPILTGNDKHYKILKNLQLKKFRP